MTGRLRTTPWARAALATYIPGGQAALIARIPAGHSLMLSAKSDRGPYRVELHNGRTTVFDRDARGAEFAACVEMALQVVWP